MRLHRGTHTSAGVPCQAGAAPSPAATRDARTARASAVVAWIVLAIIGGWVGGRRAWERAVEASVSVAPALAPLRLHDVPLDETPTPITVSVGWEHVPLTVPAWRLRTDRLLWLGMGFEDWDSVPERLRHEGLSRLFREYGDRLEGPGVWSRMNATDWDLVPPPVRVLAVLNMIDTWVAEMAPRRFDRHARVVLSDTVAAIVMVESWFNHRAVNINPAGDRDLGLAQASLACRRSLARLFRGGLVDFTLADDDYFNPWAASRVATFWFLRMLIEADGNLALAIRAYHRGIASARRGAGREYLEAVVSKRLRYIGNREAPPAWRWVLDRRRSDAGGLAESGDGRMASDGFTGYRLLSARGPRQPRPAAAICERPDRR
jgi:hypothetical protein